MKSSGITMLHFAVSFIYDHNAFMKNLTFLMIESYMLYLRPYKKLQKIDKIIKILVGTRLPQSIFLLF